MNTFLKVNQVPPVLLGRILLQLHIIPHNDTTDLLTLIAAGLQHYGDTCDLDAFLNYCQTITHKDWQWRSYNIEKEQDWNNSIYKKDCQVIGLRFFLASELARRKVELVKSIKTILLGQRFAYDHNEEFIPLNHILKDTKTHFEQNHIDTYENNVIQQVLDLRLEKFSRDMIDFERQTHDLDPTEYHLMGVIMVNSACTMCCLYLRDYAESPNGLNWRVFGLGDEKRITCEQAMIDIRGTGKYDPSGFSADYKPVYVFYGNQEIITTHAEEEDQEKVQKQVPDSGKITWEDYTFEEYIPEEHNNEEELLCIHCGIKDIVEDINDIFICESCENGVHQLCENPSVQNYEKSIDPWYCRACCKLKNLPIPQQLPPLKRKREESMNSLKLLN